MPSYQSVVDFFKELWCRIKSDVPPFFRRLQILAGGIALMAGFLLKFEAHLIAEWVPHIKHALSYSLVVAGTAQLPCKSADPSPTAALESKLAAVLPDVPTPSPTLPETGLEAPQEEETA